MRILIQRVETAHVEIAGETVGAIGAGLLVFLGVGPHDGEAEATYLAGKVARLRVFPDAAGLMNRSVQEMGGDVLVVSQFTLYGECEKGNRPSFGAAARPEQAEPLYRRFIALLEEAIGKPVATGRFGADMRVHLVNWGPITLWLEKSTTT